MQTHNTKHNQNSWPLGSWACVFAGLGWSGRGCIWRAAAGIGGRRRRAAVGGLLSRSLSLSLSRSLSLNISFSLSFNLFQNLSHNPSQSLNHSISQSLNSSIPQSLNLSISKFLNLSIFQSIIPSISQTPKLSTSLFLSVYVLLISFSVYLPLSLALTLPFVSLSFFIYY